MARDVTALDLYESYQERLGLEWLAGKNGADKPLIQEHCRQSDISPIGPLNLIHPNCIQVLGNSEIDFLEELGKNSLEDTLDKLFVSHTTLIIVTDNRTPPPRLLKRAEKSATALLKSDSENSEVIAHLDYYISSQLAQRTILHGVFMDVMGVGILLAGESAVGKSELALELITRGHQLIADDAPEFTRVSPDTLRGTCPEVLRDFLEVRGLGLLNIRAMFGEGAIKPSEELQLILNLKRIKAQKLHQLDRLKGTRHTRSVLDVEVPEFLLPVAPGRNLAVLVEAAVRSHILYNHGYDAVEDFNARQQKIMQDLQ